ncbi:MAG: butyrate kinase [Oscillospiraceae bacterium]|nr:butyrate kinase [Oscillospiraceae bacterium]
MKILVINPGSTSTKVSLFEDRTLVFEESPFHDAPELLAFPTVNDQIPFREKVVLDMLDRRGIDPASIDVFVGRGGSAYPQPAGVTVIDERLYRDTEAAVGGSEHPAKLGVMLAYRLGTRYGKPMYTADPTNVDEYCELARITGISGVYRNAQSHVLNQKAVARAHAAALGRKYEDCRFIVCHIDGGVTVSAHDHGRMVDGNVGAGGDGSFTPTRLGSVPVLVLLDYLETHSAEDVRRMCSRSGGFVSHFGTSDSDRIRAMAEQGDEKARLVWDAMIYNVCKQIGAMSAVLSGHVDGILLTGGLMRFDDIADTVRKRCGWIAPVSVYPGEMEQEALAGAVLRVLSGEETAHIYAGRPVWTGFDWD